MKTLLSLLLFGLAIGLPFAAQAQQPTAVVEQIVANMNDIDAAQKPHLKRLQLTGTLSTKGNSDFRQIRDLCPQLETLDLSQAQCREVPDNAFHSCRKLRTVVLPEGVERIGSQAFFGCRHLESVVVPASVKEIGVAAFNGCVELREVIWRGAVPKTVGNLAFHQVPAPQVQSLQAIEPSRPSTPDALIPLPATFTPRQGKPLAIGRIGRIVAAPSLHNEAAHARRILAERTGIEVLRGKADVRLLLDSTIAGDEAYVLDIDRRGVTIRGKQPAGVFYGLMTLDQLLLSSPHQLHPLHIEDAPRLGMRELMLDPARTFIPLREMKQFVVEMARYKMNALHLHLTDDQAWRIEIKSYPRLIAMSSQRPAMDDMLYASPGYYTQEEMKELVAFAAKHHVMVIPEIEIPGHEVAAIHAYPQLTPGAKRVDIRTTSGVSNELLNPASEFTYTFLFKVLDELAAVFPAPYVHLGGDEAGQPPLDCWTTDSACIALKQQLGGSAEGRADNWRLQQYLFDRVIAHLRDSLHKIPMFWYETDFKEIQPGCVVFAWRHGLTQKAIDAAVANRARIMLCPGEHCYFDYPMAADDLPEVNWGMPTISLQKAYALDPAWGQGAAFEHHHLHGVAAPLWSECIPTPERIFYQAYPRGLALAEVAWTPQARRDYTDFVRRLRVVQHDMLRRGLSTSLRY